MQTTLQAQIDKAQADLKALLRQKSDTKVQVIGTFEHQGVKTTGVQFTTYGTIIKKDANGKPIMELQKDGPFKGQMRPAIETKRNGKPVFTKSNRKMLVVQHPKASAPRFFYKTAKSEAIHDSLSHPLAIDEATFRKEIARFCGDEGAKKANWMLSVKLAESFDTQYGKLTDKALLDQFKAAFPTKKAAERQTKTKVAPSVPLTATEIDEIPF